MSRPGKAGRRRSVNQRRARLVRSRGTAGDTYTVCPACLKRECVCAATTSTEATG